MGVLDRIEEHMQFLNVEEDASHVVSQTWLYTTPDDSSPVLYVYFTYESRKVRLEAVHALP